MKILYIITLSSWGGAQKYVHDLSLNLNKKGEHTIIVAGGQESIGELARRLQQANIRFLPIKNLVRSINPIKDLAAVREIKKLIETEKPDIIHLNSSKAGAVGSLAAKMAKHKSRVIYTVHGWVFNEKLNPMVKLAYFLIEKIFSRCKDHFIFLSQTDKNTGLDANINTNENSTVIYNGFNGDADYFFAKEQAKEKINALIRPQKIFKAGELATITIANFYPAKGLDNLIEAIDRINKEHKLPITAVIIGEGQLRRQLEEKISNLGLADKVILAGSINEASRYLKAFDIAVIPSSKEGLPFFLLEAMAAGLPIISTNVGGIHELIKNGENGFLVEPQNPQLLAAKIKSLLDGNDLISRMGKANIVEVTNKFNLAKMVDKTLETYAKIARL